MTIHELTQRTDRFLIQGGRLTSAQKDYISKRLIDARNLSPNLRSAMYPYYYTPPYNDGKKYRTLLGQLPKTHILSDNAYELEILRLLCLLSPHDTVASDMVKGTLGRLDLTCFGALDDGVGECFDASLVVLRFLIAAAPNDTERIIGRIENYRRHADERKHAPQAAWYYRLCLCELAEYDFAAPYIAEQQTLCRNVKVQNELQNSILGRLCRNSCNDCTAMQTNDTYKRVI